MIILGLDTTGSQCSVSIVDDAVVRAHIGRNIGRGHAEVLAGMVEDAFADAGLTPADIDRLAVCTGPGSFTGLRVALSFAKGFALPRNLPVVGIDALTLTANLLDPEGRRQIAVQQDVRRGEFFYSLSENGTTQTPPRAILKEALDEQAAEQGVTEIHEARVDTRILAWLSMELDTETHPAEPLYSRGPDAKLPGGKSLSTLKA